MIWPDYSMRRKGQELIHFILRRTFIHCWGINIAWRKGSRKARNKKINKWTKQIREIKQAVMITSIENKIKPRVTPAGEIQLWQERQAKHTDRDTEHYWWNINVWNIFCKCMINYYITEFWVSWWWISREAWAESCNTAPPNTPKCSKCWRVWINLSIYDVTLCLFKVVFNCILNTGSFFVFIWCKQQLEKWADSMKPLFPGMISSKTNPPSVSCFPLQPILFAPHVSCFLLFFVDLPWYRWSNGGK